MPRRRNNLSLLNAALFLAVIVHGGLFLWSTTAIVPGGGLGPRLLHTLGLSDVTLSLHPPPRNTTSDIALSIRQQSAADAPVPSALAPQSVMSAPAGQPKIDASLLKVDLPMSGFGSSPLTVQVAAPVAIAAAAPKVSLPAPADLMSSPVPPRITPPPIDAGSPLREMDRPAPLITPPAVNAVQALPPAPPPSIVAVPAPPAAMKEMPSLAALPPREVNLPPMQPAAANVPALPPSAATLNLPDLPQLPSADRVVEVADSVPVVPRIVPEASRQPSPAESIAAAAPPPLGAIAPAPAELKPETSLAASPLKLTQPIAGTNAQIATPAAPPSIANAPAATALTPPPISISPSLEKIGKAEPAAAEKSAAAPPLPVASKVDDIVAGPSGAAMSRAADHQNILQPPPSGSGLSRPQASAMPVPAPPSLSAPSITATPPVVGAAPDLSLAPPKIGGPDALAQRAPEQRRPLIEKLGGTRASETAVDRALAWLAKNQERDGRWTHIDDKGIHGSPAAVRSHDMALTGLAVLAFLAADHSPAKEGPYRENVAKAVTWLMAQQEHDGDLRGAKSLRGPGSAGANFYDQAIATMALAEAALMTGDKQMTEAAMAGARFICASQNLRTGGWRYVPAESGDTSVFGWQIMALHDCEQLGFDVPPQVRDRAIHYLTLVSSGPSQTLAGYLPGEGPTPVMSAEALLCRVLLGEPLEPAGVREVTDFLTRDLPQSNKLDLYYWYYASLSLAQMQANPQVRLAWDRWNTRCRDTLIATQNRDGVLAGSWSDVHWGEYGGRVFSTALATLTLEVYYRYLPMQPSDPQDAAKAWRTINPPRAPVAPPRPKFDAN